MHFLDSSALVKAYSIEAGSNQASNIIRGSRIQPPDDRPVVSVLAHPETASAIMQTSARLNRAAAAEGLALIDPAA